MKIGLAAAPLALALALSLGACSKHDEVANATTANETLLNDEDAGAVADNGNVGALGNDTLDTAADNVVLGNDATGGNAL